jgi:hypothetical protein
LLGEVVNRRCRFWSGNRLDLPQTSAVRFHVHHELLVLETQLVQLFDELSECERR